MLNNNKVNAYNLWLVVYVAIGTISTAYGLAIIGSTIGQPNFYAYFNLAGAGEPGYGHTSNMIAALNAVNSGGAIVGCIYQSWSSEKFGRKYTILIGCLILIVGGALCAGSVNLAMFIVGRGIAGMGSGVLACVVPMYQAEVSTPETRGAMVCVTGVAYAVGYAVAAWLGFACSFMSGTDKHAQFAWRFPLAFQCFCPLVVLAGQKFIPFSPRWLLSQGRREEAFKIVCNLHMTKTDTQNLKAREEFYLIEKQYEMDSSLQNSRFELFRTAPNRKRAFMAFLLMFGNQFLGVYVIANYGVLIYSSLGQGGHTPLLLNACWTSLTLIGNTWTAFYIDRIGRRTMMLIGACGCLVSAILLCALTATYVGTTHQAGLKAGVFSCFLYIFWWCFFVDATQFVIVTEIFPNHLRSAGVALGLIAFYLGSEVTLVAAPIALNNIGWRFYLVLIVPSAFYIVALYFMLPETKGRTLEEIGALFGDEHIANKWYGVTAEEKKRIHERALHVTESGKVDDENPLPEKAVAGGEPWSADHFDDKTE